jgi:ecotin
MKKLFFASLLTGLSMVALAATPTSVKSQQKKIEIDMFPKAPVGYKQVYIQVPTQKNENDFKVEVYVGKNQLVDCNKHFLTGEMKEENLDGWGYTYYTIKSDGNIAGTMMACPDNIKTIKFIHLQPQLLRYNSKLPIVLYVPENLEVKYKIWSAGKVMQKAKTVAALTTTINSVNNIENKRWKLIELNGKKVNGNAETHYIIFHSKNGKVEAKANCNILLRDYKIKNEFQLKIADGISTLMACPDNMEQEFSAVLSLADNFTTDGKTLSLNKARMAPLARFELVK